ncbi:protein transporter SEC9 [Lentinula guzmanii]|uniref:Protein transporter SEC9 n=1 Tax=Lentinula guzmanii TaxID=2804957 RepID=A0AA38JMD2_9AGAR|nr:protein transporter SEC9 [Lentinula guzmanii]
MPLFKKNKNLIPPVESSVSSSSPRSKSPSVLSKSSLPSYRSNASTYVASRDGDPYSANESVPPSSNIPDQASYDDSGASYADRYRRGNAVGDVYSRGGAQLDQDRSELFAGFNPQKSGSGRFFDGPGAGRDPAPGEENDEDVEGIKTQTRFIKQESVNSTRNALMMARQAEETARGTLSKLGDQSGPCHHLIFMWFVLLITSITESLANTERHLDLAKSHGQRAEDKTDELKQLNRSIFRPVITFNKDAKRRAQEAKIQDRYEEERLERERTMMDVRETQNRLGRAATYGRGNDDENLLYNGPPGGTAEESIAGGGSGRFRKSEQQRTRNREMNSRYRFEATASDDELEDELDENLDEISDVTKRLKALGAAMSQELDTQNSRIDNITSKTDGVDMKLANLTRRQKKF